MRRLTFILIGCTLLALALLCSAGLLARRGAPPDLVLPGAGDVQSGSYRSLRLYITYRLPDGATLYHLRQHMAGHGWRRIGRRQPDGSRSMLVRHRWYGMVREVASIARAPANQRMVEVRVTRCLTVGSWIRCL